MKSVTEGTSKIRKGKMCMIKASLLELTLPLEYRLFVGIKQEMEIETKRKWWVCKQGICKAEGMLGIVLKSWPNPL